MPPKKHKNPKTPDTTEPLSEEALLGPKSRLGH
ncbi:Small muscular protein [Caenorhabditis elegans]|uniref:Small muscular protein n=1 Tax=Caenorhabditis elegans TaxID=6239 RepID=F9UKU2_CAEEL|nr:Small muscular protein [Caenorhabditis elegans]CCC42205.1 Small muscular protein [Caenorhabditis elegans]|eukprot:NP_001255746.1 Uncharacterized protein CELE_Y38H8A.12 [Caenorhabditis elegans]